MKRHLHAVRVVSTQEPYLPLRTLWVVEGESQNLTLDDILRVNDMDFLYEFGQSFYVGYLTEEEFEDKYTRKMGFNWMVKTGV